MSTATAKKPAAEKAAKPAAKTAAKPAAKPKAAPKAAVAKPKPAAEATAKPARVEGKALRAKDLVARVAEVTGGKVKDVKPLVEATLAELGRALDAGEALNLPPLGRVKITPAKAGSDGPMKLKLRRGGAAEGKKPAKEALADDGEDS